MEIIFIGCDHGGYELKQVVVNLLAQMQIPHQDLGCDCREVSVHYPLYAQKVIQAVRTQPGTRGILICGTGIGMSIMANRYPGIRAALCHDLFSARMSREHNDANVLVLGGRIIGPAVAREIVRVWLTTPFEGGRHQERLDLLERLSQDTCCPSRGENR
jgi:ribose 5-phosphate isomerase B